MLMIEAPSTTRFFSTCLGVFQGGGCRAAAFAGAYAKAKELNVTFVEVAGTSAGSIVAALIAAGATPEYLKDKLRELDFRNLLKRTTRVPFRYAGLVLHLGIYDSTPIEEWVGGVLKECLKTAKPVTFADLRIPTTVVAADLITKQPKIWDCDTTPTDEVAHAVRCSCTIPFFFAPVENRYVDGGVLSNLPSFVFKQKRSPHRRILAFALIDDPTTTNPKGILDYALRISSLVVEGAQEIQQTLQPHLHTITISTGHIKATDFDSMTAKDIEFLISNGEEATAKFVSNELEHVFSLDRIDRLFADREQMFSDIVSNTVGSTEEVWIAEHQTDWVYSLFPTLLQWRLDGVKVSVLLGSGSDHQRHGPYRRRLLPLLGINLNEQTDLTVPFEGVLINPQHLTSPAAFIISGHAVPGATFLGTSYAGQADQLAIQALARQLSPHMTSTSDDHVPVVEKISGDDLIARLRGVPQYSSQDVEIRVETISLDEVLSLATYIREYKVRQARLLVKLYQDQGFDLFEPAAVVLSNGVRSLLTPPVIEHAGDHGIVIEGSSRIACCRQLGISDITAVIVRGVGTPLPARPLPFDEVRIAGRELNVGDRYNDWNYEHFRHIESTVHAIETLEGT
ncbi:MAG: patatin-like phospholipase family protein [Planctomycetota bacterium]|nr:patatin-like phospholipase family protein [Planctomycetota bacterium]